MKLCYNTHKYIYDIVQYSNFSIRQDTGDVVNIVLDDLTERRTKKTVSYHAVKKESLLYQLHKLVLTRKQQRLLNRTTQKGWEIRRMNALLKLHNVSSYLKIFERRSAAS